MAKREPLWVWLHGTRVARLESTRPGQVRCTYTEEALDAWPANIPLLSCSLPLGTRRLEGKNYFSGLLPEGQHRQAMADEANLPTYDTFGLLARFGRDVAGALVVARDEPAARIGSVQPYTDAQLAADVAALPERPLALYDDSELSLPGLQDKLLLVRMSDGCWGRPVHGAPSTHILKVEDRRYPGLAEREAACLRVARAIGLTPVEVSVESIADLPCLITSRFDRTTTSAGEIARVHQEDSCQALDRDPRAHRDRGKYEEGGGPTLAQIAGVLDRYADDANAELVRLARTTTFTVIIGNADAHGKNVAVLHPTPESVALAPVYDTVPTVLWPNLRSTSAMSINGSFELDRVTIDDLVAEARRWQLDAKRARAGVVETAERLFEVARDHDLPDDVRARVAKRSRELLGG
jgi:serine/threonine-protein kinase HipA